MISAAGRRLNLVSTRLNGARYVKAFNALTSGSLATSTKRTGPDRVVVFLSGDDTDAKTIVAGLVRAAGFEPVDLGANADSASQEPGGDYYGEELHLAGLPALARL